MNGYVVKGHSGTRRWWWFFTLPLVYSVYYFPTEQEYDDELALHRFLNEQVRLVREDIKSRL